MPFDGIRAAGRRELEARAVVRRYPAGAVLFTQGTPARGLFVITEGRVRVLRGSRGRTHVVHVEGPGGTLGEVPLFDGGNYPATAIAQEDTRCVVYTPAAMAAAMAADPTVAWAIARSLAGRVRELVERLDRLAVQGVTTRLAACLLTLPESDDGLELGQTQQELAEDLGTVREVVARSLRSLRRRGVLTSAGRGRFRIADRQTLELLAES
jgi:CRP/FNR family transcriptional regulator